MKKKALLAAGKQKKPKSRPRTQSRGVSRDILNCNLDRFTVPRPEYKLGKNGTLKYLG